MFFLKCARTAGADGVELVESYPRAFTPTTGTRLRKRLRDEINHRAQVGYTRYFLPGRFYRHYDMPNPWPWALHPLLQAPAILVVDTLRRHSRPLRVSRTASPAGAARPGGEMRCDKQSHFKPAEQFRR